MKYLIVDDNKMARMAIQQLLSQLKGLEPVGECESAMEAYNMLKPGKVDLIFLDIEMPGMNGLELMRTLGKNSPLIIFTTSKKDYAADAFELNVVDYLVKPVNAQRLLQAVEKAQEAIQSRSGDAEDDGNGFVFIRDNGVLRRVNTSDILYFEAMGDYVKVYTSDKFHVVHSTLKSLEEKLSPSRFMRVHRSYIVALPQIEYIQDGMIHIGRATIPVADAYKSPLNQRLNTL